ncbi:MAG: malectin domain-containing carbohydrate-binding protein [Acidobacteriaceae bacterium]
MPVQNQDAVDLEAAREELQAVLQSKAFRAAPTLAGLLSYLCEKRIAGDTSQIKEYSIGVDVFHRGPDFNQESDSIVRVEINRLRKRLAEYYAQEGASHRLRIGIPVGQYIPEFQTVAAPEPDESAKTVATVSPVAAPVPSRSLHLRLVALTAGSVVLLVGAVLVVFFVFWNRGPKPPATVLHPSPSAVAEPTIGLPPGDEIRILAGSPRSYVDHAGKLWNADTWFSGGTAVHSDVRHIDRTQDPSFYRSSRQGQFRYDIPLKPGVYELHLHFAETVYGPDNSGMGGEGSRLFSVRANGQPLLTRFDILADAGGGDIADDRVFTDLSPARDGRLHLEFAGEDGKDAAVSAIEILPGVRGRIRPVRILARENPYYSNDSQWWSPDNYFAGGQLAAYSDPVTGTDDPDLYESERWGNFSYAIPVAPGKYTVRLLFAIRHRGWNQPPSASGEEAPVGHVFSVFCNGQAVLENFDLPREAQHSDIVVRTFMGLEPNAQGKLLLSFVPVKGYATVTGIEVLPE